MAEIHPAKRGVTQGASRGASSLEWGWQALPGSAVVRIKRGRSLCQYQALTGACQDSQSILAPPFSGAQPCQKKIHRPGPPTPSTPLLPASMLVPWAAFTTDHKLGGGLQTVGSGDRRSQTTEAAGPCSLQSRGQRGCLLPVTPAASLLSSWPHPCSLSLRGRSCCGSMHPHHLPLLQKHGKQQLVPPG